MTLHIALPKGRLGKQAYELLKSVGYRIDTMDQSSRKLIFSAPDQAFQFLLVKASDVPIYVERGIADIGIAGKDVIDEGKATVLEMLDLDIGCCQFALIAPRGYRDNPKRRLVVATKYITVAKRYFAHQNREIELVKLNGSVELAPLVGLSDVIVDIVETGTTLREHDLIVLDFFAAISARLIVNEASYHFQKSVIDELLRELRCVVEERMIKK